MTTGKGFTQPEDSEYVRLVSLISGDATETGSME